MFIIKAEVEKILIMSSQSSNIKPITGSQGGTFYWKEKKDGSGRYKVYTSRRSQSKSKSKTSSPSLISTTSQSQLPPVSIPEKEVISLFDLIPRDIVGYLLDFFEPKELRSVCALKAFQSLCKKSSILEQYLGKKGLNRYVRSVNRGLNWAVEIGSLELVKFFVQKGAPGLNWAMKRSSQKDYRNIVEYILAQPDDPRLNLDEALEAAARVGSLNLVKDIISRGSTWFEEALRAAARGGHREVIDFLINKYNAKNLNVALSAAAEKGDKTLVDYLLEKGATSRKNALEGAIRGGHRDLVDFFLVSQTGSSQVPKDELNSFGMDLAISCAAENGHYNMVQFFVNTGRCDTKHNQLMRMIMEGAVRGGHIDIVKMLSSYTFTDGGHELTIAALKGYQDLVDYFFMPGVTREYDLNLALEWAAQGGHIDIVKFLLENGALALEEALCAASREGDFDLVDYLIKEGAEDIEGAFDQAAEYGHLDMIKFLLILLHDKNEKPDFGNALIGAASGGHHKMIEFLISQGASNLDEAMRAAAADNRLSTVKLFIEKGAKNYRQIAQEYKDVRNPRIVNYLSSLE